MVNLNDTIQPEVLPFDDPSVEDTTDAVVYEEPSLVGPVTRDEVAVSSTLIEDRYSTIKDAIINVEVAKADIDSGMIDQVMESATNSLIEEERLDFVNLLVENPELADDSGIEASKELIATGAGMSFDEAFVESTASVDAVVEEKKVTQVSEDVELVEDEETVEVTLSEEAKKSIARTLELSRILGETAEGFGFWDNILSFFGAILPFRDTYEIEEVEEIFSKSVTQMMNDEAFAREAKKAGLDPKDIDSWEDPKAFIRLLPPELGMQLGKLVIENRLKEDPDPNTLLTINALSKQLDVNPDNFNEERFWEAISLFDVFLAFREMRLLTKSTKRVQAVGNQKLLASIMAEAADDTRVANNVGVTSLDVASSQHVAKLEKVSPASSDGIAADVDKIVNSREYATQVQLDLIEETASRLDNSVTHLDNLTSVRKGIEEQNIARTATNNPADYKIKQVEEGKTETKITVKVDDKQSIIFKMPVKESDADYFKKNAGTTYKGGFFPQPLAALPPELIKEATRLEQKTARAKRLFEDATKAAIKGLSTKEKNVVFDTLEAGDDAGLVYSKQDLVANYGFNNKQVDSYMSFRRIADKAWDVQNAALRRDLDEKGYRYIPVKGAQQAGMARKVDNTEGLYEVYDLNTNTLRTYDSAADVGKVVHEMYEPTVVKQADGKEVTFMNTISSEDTTRLLPVNVLNKPKGYWPRAFENVNAVVKKQITYAQGGRTVTREITERLGSSLKELETNLGAIAEDIGANVKDLKVVRSSELSDNDVDTLKNLANGGLFYSVRSDRDLKYGYNGVKPTRVSPAEVLQRMADNVANTANYSQFRNLLVDDFMNKFGHLLADKTQGWNSPLNPSISVSQKKAANYYRDWVKDVTGMQTRETSKMRDGLMSIAEMIDPPVKAGKANRLDRVRAKTRDMVFSVASTDPLALGRTAAMHQLLGGFNVFQYVMQASGAVSAFAISPLTAPLDVTRAMYLSSKVSFLKEVDNAATLKKFLVGKPELVKQLGLNNVDDAMDLVTAYKKSGLPDGVMSNPDYQAAERGFSVSNNVLKKMGDTSLFFFRKGEEFARSYGFSFAYREWRAANPKAKITEDVVAQLTDRTFEVILNMTKANRAPWQRNSISGTFFQFYQVMQKYWGAVLGTAKTGLTGPERFRMHTSMSVLFGANGGVPFADPRAVSEATVAGLDRLGLAPSDIESREELQRVVENGLFGWTFDQMTEEDFEIAKRLSTGGGTYESITKPILQMARGITKGELPTIALQQIPSGSVATRWLRLVQDLQLTFQGDATVGFEPSTITKVMLDVSNLLSSTSNATKVWVAKQTGNTFYTRDGRANYTMPLNTWDTVVRGLGVQTTLESDYYKAVSDAYYNTDVERELVNHMAKFIIKDVSAQNFFSLKGDRGFDTSDFVTLYLETLLPEGMDKGEFMNKVFTKLDESGYDRLADKLINQSLKGTNFTGTLLEKREK